MAVAAVVFVSLFAHGIALGHVSWSAPSAAALQPAKQESSEAPNATALQSVSSTPNVTAPKKQLKVTEDNQRKFDDLDRKRKAVGWHKQKVPEHIKSATAKAMAKAGVVRSIPVVQRGGCGERITAQKLGLKKSEATSQLFKNPSLMQVAATERRLRGGPDKHPGRDSWSRPGVGVDQELADNGRGVIGKVSGKDPYVTVLKDGWFEVGCYADAMWEFGDKYGRGKFSYKMGEQGNVSIARYSDLIVKDEQKPMTPTICFEFCRTVPGMVFFGINAGRDCYCTPFYKPSTIDDARCDQGCEGDPTRFCGNMGKKSTIWEMHLCASTATDLANSMAASKEALDFYFENALLAFDLGTRMSKTGSAVEEVGGLSGSTTAATNGRFAESASKNFIRAYQTGAESYGNLMVAYENGKEVENEDFTESRSMLVAEHAIATMKEKTAEVIGAAAEIHFLNQLAYPLSDSVVFGDAPNSGDAMGTMLARYMAAKDTFKNINFREVPYAMGETTFAPEASSCSGPTIGSPLVGMGMAGCAAACDATVAPQNCLAFSLYNVDGETDVCILLEDVKAIETFLCAGDAQKAGPSAGAKCMVKLTEVATGFRPKAEMKKLPRCFSTKKAFGVKEDVEELSLPGDSEIKIGAGAPLVKAD